MDLQPEMPPGAVQVNLNARPVRDEDEPFLKALRAEMDSERLLFDSVDLAEEEKKLILDLQYRGHRKHFDDINWEKSECVIEFDGKPAGFFIVMQDKDEIQLADIVVTGDFRGLGIGFAIIQGIQGEAAQSKRPLRLHVAKVNPALRLYERMGFQLLEDRVTHLFLEWLPPNMQGQKLYFPGQ